MFRLDVRWTGILWVVLGAACRPTPPPPTPAEQLPTTPPDVVIESEPPACTIDVGETGLRRLTATQYVTLLHTLTGADPSLLTPLPRAGGSTISQLEVEVLAKNAEAAVAQGGHLSFVPCDPAGAEDEACLRGFIQGFGLRLFRRPVLGSEEETLVETWNRLRTHPEIDPEPSFREGLDAVAEVMLQSLQLAWRNRFGELALDAPAGLRRTTGYERAEALAFFLTDAAPDGELLEAAAKGELDTDEGLRLHAGRLLDSASARTTARRFASEWLGLNATDRVLSLETRPKSFPNDSPELRSAMRAEVEWLYERVLFEGDAKFSTLMTSRDTRVNGPLAALYGLPVPPDLGPDRFVTATLDGSQRAGLFTRAAFLAQWAGAEHTSPVRRGVELYRHVLCLPLGSPPANVNNVPPEPQGEGEQLTTRAAVERVTSAPACSGCHALVNPLGFALESYDALGAHRTEERVRTSTGEIVTLPVDTATPLHGGDLGTSVKGPVDLSERLATSALAHDCHVQRWFERLTGRAPAPEDRCALEGVQRRFRKSGDLRALLLDLATGPHVKWVRPQTEGKP